MFDSDIGGGDETLAFSEEGGPRLVGCLLGSSIKAPLPLGTECEERARDRCGRLLRQLKQRSRRSMRRHRSAMEAATI